MTFRFDILALADSIERSEGRVDTMYEDHKGNLTIGVGHKLKGNPIPQEAIDIIFRADLNEAIDEARKICQKEEVDWDFLPMVIQEVLIEMVFQMGTKSVRGFKCMWDSARARNWKAFRFEMLDSKWAREDTPERACKLADKVMGLWRSS